MKYEKVEDTYFEAFSGFYVRLLITGPTEKIVKKAAYDSTATPCAVIGRPEGGVEGFLDPSQTPDGRFGAIVQFWIDINNYQDFPVELSYRIRQDILVKPFTRVFDYFEGDSFGLSFVDMKGVVGHCGDGYEKIVEKYGRKMVNVPLAVPDFQIQSLLTFSPGVMGANFWYLCKDQQTVLDAGDAIIDAISDVGGAITPFDVCSAASKPETNYPDIGPTTNHYYCPSLKEELGDESKVPDGVNYIPEIVINAINEDAMMEAVKKGIDAAIEFEGVVKISAGNFGGSLGDMNFNLLDILK